MVWERLLRSFILVLPVCLLSSPFFIKAKISSFVFTT